MRYSVRWKPNAERQLAQIWLESADKATVAKSADTFEASIERDAPQVGESRPGRARIAFVRPLGFLFDVYPETKQVEVIDVWRFRN